MNKVTFEGIKAKIKDECYLVLPDGRTTVCMITMENGYTIKGLSACVDAANFDIELGRNYAYEDAFRQIWPLEGYLLAQNLHENNPITLSTSSVLTEAHKQLNEEINVWIADQKKDKVVATYTTPKKRGRPRKTVGAPYGYKKDGTPKKKPGRSLAS